MIRETVRLSENGSPRDEIAHGGRSTQACLGLPAPGIDSCNLFWNSRTQYARSAPISPAPTTIRKRRMGSMSADSFVVDIRIQTAWIRIAPAMANMTVSLNRLAPSALLAQLHRRADAVGGNFGGGAG